MEWTPRRLRQILNVYPPYLGAGVRITRVDPDWSEIRVSMKLRWWNRNAVGTHFGGSLYSMVDPHLMLLFIKGLGREYVVWDKSATIDFKKPGRGTLEAVLRVSDSDLETARRATAGGAAYLPTFEVEIRDDEGDVVALVKKTLHIREKP